jgi:sulfate adenylyltransferase subunit 1
MVTARRSALRFVIAGSVDDGKSTLTGRLLYECNAILSDQLDALERKSVSGVLDLALVADGLEAEREQGITIDVAHRYLSTPQRKFIIADAPGHEEYTRNMVTAAAGTDAAVVLVDATKLQLDASPLKLLPQTHRHALLVRLLDIPSVVFVVNKMDAVSDPPRAYHVVRDAILKFAQTARIPIAGIIPISALRGDNVASRSNASWYSGPSLLELLEDLPSGSDRTAGELLMPVQYVGRDPQHGDGALVHNPVRVVWGRVARGSIRAGDPIQVFPSNQTATVMQVMRAGEETEGVESGESAGVVLDRHVDVARGSWLSSPHSIVSSERFSGTLAWMDGEPASVGRKYLVRHGTRWVGGRIVAIESCLDVHTLEPKSAHALSLNDIGEVIVETQDPLPIETYRRNHVAGSMIIVDASTHRTSGVLLVSKVRWDEPADGRADERIAVDFKAAYRTSDGHSGTGRIRNLSMGGLMMSGDAAIAVGDMLEVSLEIPAGILSPDGVELRAHARVVAHRFLDGEGYIYHLAFYDVNLETYERLSLLVRSAG